MQARDIQRQESESVVFDVEKGDGMKSEIKRRNRWMYCLNSIIIPIIVTVIMFLLMVITERTVFSQWSPPMIKSSSGEITSLQMPQTAALKDAEYIKQETRGSAHLFYNTSPSNKSCGGAQCYCVMWENPPKWGSFVSEGIKFHNDTGRLQVQESGVYQIYAKLTLKLQGETPTEKLQNPLTYSTLRKNEELKPLTMEQFKFPLPGNDSMYHVLHFGIYLLNANDTICVTLDNKSINYIWRNAYASFFGLHLIGRR